MSRRGGGRVESDPIIYKWGECTREQGPLSYRGVAWYVLLSTTYYTLALAIIRSDNLAQPNRDVKSTPAGELGNPFTGSVTAPFWQGGYGPGNDVHKGVAKN